MSVTLPKFPEDFRVLYTEGASYWWWSPREPEGFDGTVPVGDPFPPGLVIGDEETSSHELVDGSSLLVAWMDADMNPIAVETSEYRDHDQVNTLIRHVLAEADVLHDISPE